MNYADDRQQVRVEFGRSVTGETLSADGAGQAVRGDRAVLDLDIYTVVVYRGAGET